MFVHLVDVCSFLLGYMNVFRLAGLIDRVEFRELDDSVVDMYIL